jgi:hypothetical protein
MLQRLDFRRRARAAGIHLVISAAVAAMAAALVFGLWYPGLYRLASGGRDLFLLVTSSDVILGPLLTFAVFNLTKGWKHLRRDLAIIGAIQVAALVYGLHTVYLARPVAMVFEVDRFRVIVAADVYEPELPKAPPAYRTLPLTGPWLLGTRAPKAGDEHTDAIFMGVQGIDRANRPLFWQAYGESAAQALARARPVQVLLEKYPAQEGLIGEALKQLRLAESDAKFLPVVARGGDWVAILDRAGNPVQYLPVDGFF